MGSGFTEVLYQERQAAERATALRNSAGRRDTRLSYEPSASSLPGLDPLHALPAVEMASPMDSVASAPETVPSSMWNATRTNGDQLEAQVLKQALRALHSRQVSLAVSILEERLAMLEAAKAESSLPGRAPGRAERYNSPPAE
mmetsp:Transcript_14591/g.37774  ORF Transcript_14591/g.37774 Transcript_14591/m.37774 type:complete len:143 (+) Transcript_14591:1-429(+)